MTTFYTSTKILLKTTFIATLLLIANLLTAQDAEWTFMIYLDGDNDLEGAAVEDFNEMEAIGSSDDINIVVQFDRTFGYDDSNGDWEETRRYLVEKDNELSSISTPPLETLGELNMGDKKTLTNFIKWSAKEYPAKKYALVLWNHGGGWRAVESSGFGEQKLVKDVCYDETDGDFLSNAEVSEAIRNSNVHFDILAYDACLMGMMEVAYQAKDLADVMVASEEVVPGDGFDYKGLIEGVAAASDADADSVSKIIVQSYAGFAGYEFQNTTLSAFDLTQMNTVSDALDTLLVKLMDCPELVGQVSDYVGKTQRFQDKEFKDLIHFVEQIVAGCDNAEIVSAAQSLIDIYNEALICNYASKGFSGAYGMAVYLPNPEDYESGYSDEQYELHFADSTLWDEFLIYMHNNGDFNEVNDFGALATPVRTTEAMKGIVSNSEDVDFYRIYFSGEGSDSVSINAQSDLEVVLVSMNDTVENFKNYAEVSVSEDGLIVLNEDLSQGYYYLVFAAETGEQVTYEFSYTAGDQVGSDSPYTYVFDENEAEKGYNPGNETTGVGMQFKGGGVMQGVWYYVTNLSGENGDMKLRLYDASYETEFYFSEDVFTPEKEGWNYIDLSSEDVNLIDNEVFVLGFSWEGENNMIQLAYDTLPSYNNIFIYNDTWQPLNDTAVFYIRPVMIGQGSTPGIDTCYCKENVVLAEATGSFSDGSADDEYGNNSNCSWLIKPKKAETVELKFTDFSTEEYWDFVKIYDGETNKDQLLAELSGEINDSTIKSTGGALYIEFTSDSDFNFDGWNASYKAIVKEVSNTITGTTTGLLIYPNPGNGIVTVQNDAMVNNESLLEVLNMAGQVVLQQRLDTNSGALQFDISHMQPGIYLIRVQTGSNLLQSTYILK